MREFGVDARLVGATVGPTVTRYELELAPGVKVNRVTSLAKEIAYSMASHDVRILAPIPGRSAIGVEVPNKARPIVTLGDILASDEAKKATHPLEVAMGRDIAGRAVMSNLATFPHVLIAGQTGAGKSSCINSIVTSLLMRTTPDQVRLILVDPKRVELGAVQRGAAPAHRGRHQPEEGGERARLGRARDGDALRHPRRRRRARHHRLQRDVRPRRPADAPTIPIPTPGKRYERLPFIVVVVDELADLMMVAARDVETSICRLAQMARAVGIHLVIATQRPSVDVITGVIKANIPSRLAFSVSTLADSRVILDQPGAEKLIGKGDMLMLDRVVEPHRAHPGRVGRRGVRAQGRRALAPPDRASRTTSRASRAPTARAAARRRRRRRRRPARRGDGARRPQRPRLHEHAAAQAPRRLRPRRPADGPARAARRRRPVGGFEGARGADDVDELEEMRAQ